MIHISLRYVIFCKGLEIAFYLVDSGNHLAPPPINTNYLELQVFHYATLSVIFVPPHYYALEWQWNCFKTSHDTTGRHRHAGQA